MTAARSPVDLLHALPPGTRVTVRWALPSGDESRKRFTDSIGTIVASPAELHPDDDARHDASQDLSHAAEGGAPWKEADAERASVTGSPRDVLVLDTRRGRVEIPWSAIHLAKPVPPPPPRRARKVRSD